MSTNKASSHSIKWFAVFADGSMMPREKSMPDSGFGWDAKCSCGWESRTGGAIAACVRRYINEHKEYAWLDELSPNQINALVQEMQQTRKEVSA